MAYFVSLVLLGNFILLNLFLAILLNNFSESDDAPEDQSSEEEEEDENVLSPLSDEEHKGDPKE